MKKVLFASIFVLLIVFSAFALAEDNSTNNTTGDNTMTNSTTANIANASNQNWEARCSGITGLIDKKIQVFDDGNNKRLNVYDNMDRTLNTTIQRLNQTGANITQLSSDFEELKAREAIFDSNYSDFIASLKTTQNFTCGHSQGEFVSSLKEAKTFLPILREDATSIRAQLMKVRADIMSIRMGRLNQEFQNRTQMMENRINRLENRSARIGNRTGMMGNRTGMMYNNSGKGDNQS